MTLRAVESTSGEPEEPVALDEGRPEPEEEQRLNAFARPFDDLGKMALFFVDAVRDIPLAVRLYPSEIARQTGLLIRSNALVVIFMLFMLGALMGITGSFVFEGVGLESYVSAINAVPMMRGPIEIVFGWVLAAKAGCGIVAELGAMRISEEVDAMEVMGIRSRAYLVSTRIVAAVITLPLLFIVSLAIHFWSARLFNVDFLGTVSEGGFTSVLYLFMSPRDVVLVVLWAVITGLAVVSVACYHGYHASGGPVGVGRATAQAMLVNLVLISVIAVIYAQVFWAGQLDIPFGT